MPTVIPLWQGLVFVYGQDPACHLRNKITGQPCQVVPRKPLKEGEERQDVGDDRLLDAARVALEKVESVDGLGCILGHAQDLFGSSSGFGDDGVALFVVSRVEDGRSEQRSRRRRGGACCLCRHDERGGESEVQRVQEMSKSNSESKIPFEIYTFSVEGDIPSGVCLE